MIARLAVLAAFTVTAATIGFADVIPNAPLAALAILAWGIWLAGVRKAPR